MARKSTFQGNPTQPASIAAAGAIGVILSAVTASAQGMQPLDERAMSEIYGQDGVSVSLELRVNADESGNPLDTMGTCTASQNLCRIAFEFAGRDDKWLVLKDAYGILRIEDFHLDAAPDLGGVGSDSAYFDAARFESPGEECLLAGSGNDCEVSDIAGSPALQTTYPEITSTYSASSRSTDGYSSIRLGYTVGRASTEFGPDGYDLDQQDSFLGLKIGDLNRNTAGAEIQGNAYVFGF